MYLKQIRHILVQFNLFYCNFESCKLSVPAIEHVCTLKLLRNLDKFELPNERGQEQIPDFSAIFMKTFKKQSSFESKHIGYFTS